MQLSQDIGRILAQGSIAELAHAFQSKSLSIREAVEWYLGRIDSLKTLNAVREISPRALEEAKRADAAPSRGPLHGIPVLLKDNIFAEGMAASAGARALAAFKPRREATLAWRLREAGAIVLGKTNMTELADYVADAMPSGFSGAGGVVKNPHGIEYGRGQGSSVGSAAAVAAALAPVAIGSETQNSIQTPASYSSVVGYKPSVGLVSRAGLWPLVPSQDSPGPLARSVADAALVASIMAGADPRDAATFSFAKNLSFNPRDLKGIRIGVPRRQIADREDFSKIIPLFNELLQRLVSAGATIVDPCDLPSAEQLQEVRSSVFRTEFKAALNALLEDRDAPCGIGSLEALIKWNEAHPEAIPYGQSLLLAAQATSGLADSAYRADRARDIALSRDAGIDAALAMHDVDALIAPMGAAAKCTGKAGAPVVAIPAGLGPNGIPFGITLLGSFGTDTRLLAIAAAVERTIGQRILIY